MADDNVPPSGEEPTVSTEEEPTFPAQEETQEKPAKKRKRGSKKKDEPIVNSETPPDASPGIPPEVIDLSEEIPPEDDTIAKRLRSRTNKKSIVEEGEEGEEWKEDGEEDEEEDEEENEEEDVEEDEDEDEDEEEDDEEIIVQGQGVGSGGNINNIFMLPPMMGMGMFPFAGMGSLTTGEKNAEEDGGDDDEEEENPYDMKFLKKKINSFGLDKISKENAMKIVAKNDSDNVKWKARVDKFLQMPFNKYATGASGAQTDIKKYFEDVWKNMETKVYGLTNVKEEILNFCIGKVQADIRNSAREGAGVGEGTGGTGGAGSGKRELIKTRVLALHGSPGVGKCFGKGASFLTSRRFIVRVENIQVGMRLLGPMMEEKLVIRTTRGMDIMYKVFLPDNEWYCVTQDHGMILWDTEKKELIRIEAQDVAESQMMARLTGGNVARYKGVRIFEKGKMRAERFDLFWSLISKKCEIDNNLLYIEMPQGRYRDEAMIGLIKSMIYGLGYSCKVCGKYLVIDLLRAARQTFYDIDVVKVGYGPYFGFEVETDNLNDHIVLMADYSLTHNSHIVRNGIGEMLGRPFFQLSMNGCKEAYYLTGSEYLWVGSTIGKITELLISSKVMNPIIFLDEIDKISDSASGMEISNILARILDPVQNMDFEDKYFPGVKIDLSQVLFICAFNYEKNIDPILKDRLYIIDIPDPTKKDKVEICKKYLVREVLQEKGLLEYLDKIIIDDEMIEDIIENHTDEKGVRGLKRAIEDIYVKINTLCVIGKSDVIRLSFSLGEIKFPLHLTKDHIKILLKKEDSEKERDREKVSHYIF